MATAATGANNASPAIRYARLWRAVLMEHARGMRTDTSRLKSVSVGCRLSAIERGVGHLPLMVR